MEESFIWTILAIALILLVLLSALTLISFLVYVIINYMAKINIGSARHSSLDILFLTISRYSLIAAVSLWSMLFILLLVGLIIYTSIFY